MLCTMPLANVLNLRRMSNTASSSDDDRTKHDAVPEPPLPVVKKPNVFRRLWTKAGLRPMVVKLMIKGALPPIIALAAFQSDTWANEYTTLGYLVAIISFLSMPITPRAKFMQQLTANVLITCAGAALGLLQIQCVVSARKHTGGSTSATVIGSSGSMQTLDYNAAASAVSCIFLLCTIWGSNYIRGFRHHLTFPAINYTIYTVVVAVYAPQFPNMEVAQHFTRRMIICFLTGFALAAGVSLFIFPITSRELMQTQMGTLAGLFKKILNAHGDYMNSIGTTVKEEPEAAVKGAVEAQKLRDVVSQIDTSFTKVRLDMGYAKKEIAFGKWTPTDITDIYVHFRDILLPAIGLSTFVDIMQSAKEKFEHDAANSGVMKNLSAIKRLETEEWHEVLALSRGPFVRLKESLIEGIDHICLVLEITKKPKKKAADVEEKADSMPRPGDSNFAKHLDNEVYSFHLHRQNVMQRWCEKKGIELPTTFWEDSLSNDPIHPVSTAIVRKKENQYQLYLILYLEFLIFSVGKAIVAMVKYADSKVADGTMKRRRFINPGWARLRKLFMSVFHLSESDNVLADQDGAGAQVWIGDSLKRKRDPEHLPPTSTYQEITDLIRKVPHFLGSEQSAFAFRAVMATLSIGILSFLRETQSFFLEQRGLWALIMVAISLSPHTGQGLFSLASRVCGTIAAMTISLIVWYIGYKQPGAIIPIFFLVLLFDVWWIVHFPTYAIVGIISVCSELLIIGYELQADKIGQAVATSNGQKYYHVYLIAPYRLTAVLAGLTTAFVWSIFPYPVTSHTTLRKEIGSTLYLIANYYSCVHTTVDVRLHAGIRAKPGDKTSPVARLDKARLQVLQKCMLMLGRLREHSDWARYEPTFGGKFPKHKYDDLTESLSRIFRYLCLISYSTSTFVEASEEEESEWLRDFRQFTADINITSHEITSTLCLVSASILNGQPLPPYLRVPKPYAVAKLMEDVDPEIVSVKHVAEPCYAAFAVLEVASSLLTEEVAVVVQKVKDLVGEVDFSFHVMNPGSEASSSSTGSTIWDSERQSNKDKVG